MLDAGISSQANLDWLKDKGYHYIVVSRERHKQKPDLNQGAAIVKPTIGDQVIAQRVEDTETGEVRLYCHSQKREAKDQAIRTQFNLRYEAALTSLHEGLTKKGTTKKYEKILERLGRLKEKHARVSQDYSIVVNAGGSNSDNGSDNNSDITTTGGSPDNKKLIEQNSLVTEILWTRKDSASKKDDNMGVYCLRTDINTLTEKELWQTYVMLTDVEASFKSMKSELGLRPIYHQKEERVTAHLFITLLAYHLVHTLRTQFKHKGIHLSWQSIRDIMASQQRVTVSMPTAEQQQLYIRTTTEAELVHQPFYQALNLKSDVLGASKTTIGKDQKITCSA